MVTYACCHFRSAFTLNNMFVVRTLMGPFLVSCKYGYLFFSLPQQRYQGMVCMALQDGWGWITHTSRHGPRTLQPRLRNVFRVSRRPIHPSPHLSTCPSLRNYQTQTIRHLWRADHHRSRLHQHQPTLTALVGRQRTTPTSTLCFRISWTLCSTSATSVANPSRRRWGLRLGQCCPCRWSVMVAMTTLGSHSQLSTEHPWVMC